MTHKPQTLNPKPQILALTIPALLTQGNELVVRREGAAHIVDELGLLSRQVWGLGFRVQGLGFRV